VHKDDLTRLRIFRGNVATEIRSCTACKICMEAGYAPTPPSGFPKYPVIFIGRNPGITEMQTGAPFVGKTKLTIDRILKYLGYDRQNVWITNVVKCYTRDPRPDRPPTREEVFFCGEKWLDKELESIKPQVVVTFGKDAFQFATRGAWVTCTDMTGQPYPIPKEKYMVFPLYHPGQMIRNMHKFAPIMDRDMAALQHFLRGLHLLGPEPQVQYG